MIFKQKHFNRSYLKNILTLSSAVLLAQALNVIISPFLTRMYTPSELGAYTLVITLVTIMSLIVNGRYEVAIVTAQSDREANTLVVASFWVGIVVTLVYGLSLVVIEVFCAEWLGQIRGIVYISVPAILISGIINVLTSYNNRCKEYKTISDVTLSRSVVQASGQLGLGLLNCGYVGLLVANLLSLFSGLLRQSKNIMARRHLFSDITLKEVVLVLKMHYRLPLFSAMAVLANTLSYSILNIFINSLYSLDEVGYYSLSFRLLGIPIMVIGYNVGRVFFERASSERTAKGNFYSTFWETSKLLTLLSIPVFLFLMVVAVPLFELVFGTGWGRAGLFVVILSPMFAVRLIVSPLTLAAQIANKQALELTLQMVFLISAVVVYMFSKKYGLRIELFLGLISGTFLTTYVIWYFIMLKISKHQTKVSESFLACNK